MSIVLVGLAIVSVAELLLWITPKGIRKALAALIILTLSVLSGLLFGDNITVWTTAVLALSLYRMVNLLRVVENRMQPSHLWRVTRLTSFWLIGGQLLILAATAVSNHYMANTPVNWLSLLAVVQLAAASMLWVSTAQNLKSTQLPEKNKILSDKELPSLSVAIPARNETRDLEDCLRSLLTSNYPKLEILVLDDCSQNKRTPGIIRDFAQSGVVFVAGEVPPTQWLAKNYAYKQLVKKANGELLLFCGVDTRFQPDSLRSMVNVMIQEKKQMISFIPKNHAPGGFNIESLLIQPFRYAWELALPRRLANRPPVLSTCWLTTAKALQANGGFQAVSRSISPESYFARSTSTNGNRYSFLQAANIDLTSVKSLPEQRSTAVRTRYPQLHRRPELVSLLSLGELTVLVLPLATFVFSIIGKHWVLTAVSAASIFLLADFYARIVNLTYGHFLWRGVWTLPLAALYDIGLLKYSMWQYEFKEVIWKGRNVCVPVMRAIRD